MLIEISDICDDLEEIKYNRYCNAYFTEKVDIFFRDEIAIVIIFGYLVFGSLIDAYNYITNYNEIHLYVSNHLV